MLLRLAARYFLRTAAVLTLGASFAGGCSRQGEGERCDWRKAGGNGDCDSGLVCKLCEDLQDGTTDRCCPPGNTYSDSRCQPGTSLTCESQIGTGGTSSTGGTSGSGGNGGSGAVSGGDAGGTDSGGTDAGGTGGTDSGSAGADTAGQAGDTAGG